MGQSIVHCRELTVMTLLVGGFTTRAVATPLTCSFIEDGVRMTRLRPPGIDLKQTHGHRMILIGMTPDQGRHQALPIHIFGQIHSPGSGEDGRAGN